MSEISPEAQALIDRLTRMDSANPRHDKAAIERGITKHLAALGLPSRPFIWAEDARAGYRIATERTGDASGFVEPALDAAWTDAEAMAVKTMTSNITMDTAVASWRAARAAVAVMAVLSPTRRSPAAMTATPVTTAMTAVRAAFHAVDAIAGRTASPQPDTTQRAAIWLPLLDAFEAGLFLYWIRPKDVVSVLQPSFVIQNDHLHCADGPALWWPSGEAHYFWRDVRIPGMVIEEPERLTIAVIRAESNQEIRRCMVEIYGLPRYFKSAGARLVHQDEYGKLWEAHVGEEIWRIVEVENGTPEPDGTRRIYTLDVTDAAEVLGWPIETARAARRNIARRCGPDRGEPADGICLRFPAPQSSGALRRVGLPRRRANRGNLIAEKSGIGPGSSSVLIRISRRNLNVTPPAVGRDDG